MTHSGNVTEQIEGIRQKTIAVLDELMANAAEFELADPPAAFERYRGKLRENAYKVLVVGEAKRGKSTFVNALIGRDILPTDVDVATSQVFNIRPSEAGSLPHAVRGRFRAGDPPGGSPALRLADRRRTPGAFPPPTEVIRWIEVDMPIRFLPKGVSILDTPGLGALYAGHAQITHRFVPEADAVIFVLESGQPVVEDDLKFIEEILTVTRNIFFVQTKIDQYTKEDWQSIQRRNEEILEERFKDRLTDTRVWPISSTNLRKAASADEKTEQAYLMVSRHKELEAALQAFLARVVGLGPDRRGDSGGRQVPRHEPQGARRPAGRADRGVQAEASGAAEGRRGRQAAVRRRVGNTGPEVPGAEGGSAARHRGREAELLQHAATGQRHRAGPEGEDRRGLLPKAGQPGRRGNARRDNDGGHEQLGADLRRGPAAVRRAAGTFRRGHRRHRRPGRPRAVRSSLTDDDPEDKFKRDYFTMLRSAAGGGMLVMGVSSMGSMMMPAAAAAAFTTVMPFVAIPALAVLAGGGIKSAWAARSRPPSSS